MSRVIGFDTETYYDDVVSVKKTGPSFYARQPEAYCYFVSVFDGTERWAGQPQDFNWDSLTGAKLVSANASFDQEIYLNGVEKGLWKPTARLDDWDCVLDMSQYLGGHGDLASASSNLLGREVSKSVRAAAKAKHWPRDFTQEEQKAMYDYAAEDAVLAWQLWDKYESKWPEFERRLSRLTRTSARHGVLIDAVKLDAGIATLQKVVIESTDNLPWVVRGYKPASPIGIAEQCRIDQIPGMPVKAHDPEAAEEWLETYSPKVPWISALKNIRKAKKGLAALETLKARTRPDGTVQTSLRYFGAHTGRWSGANGFNFQNLAKDPLFGIDFRSLLVARPNKTFAICDLSQIEPRCIMQLTNDQEQIRMVRDGYAIYEAHARKTMGWTGGSLKVEDKKKYALAKARVLGLGYGCGWEKFILVAMIMAGVDLCADDETVALEASVDKTIYTDETGVAYVVTPDPKGGPPIREDVYGANARKQVSDFRLSAELITAIWDFLDSQLDGAVGNDLVLELPSGRSLHYRNVRRERRKVVNKKTGETYERWVTTAEVEGSRYKLWGSILLENITQAFARDVFGIGLLRVLDNLATEAELIFTAHDEGIWEVPDSWVSTEPILKEITVAPTWASDLPVGAEGELSKHYKK